MLRLSSVIASFILLSSFLSSDALQAANQWVPAQPNQAPVEAHRQQDVKDSWPLPVLKPTEHSFFSTNVTRSANFITRYFKGSRLLPGDSFNRSGKSVAVVEYCPRANEDCITFRFVEDKRKNSQPHELAQIRDMTAGTHSLQQDQFIETSDLEWDRVASAAMGHPVLPSEFTRPTRHPLGHETTYSPWIDFHDGISGETFDVDQAISDGVLMQKYNFGPLRIPLPSTLYSLELIGGFSNEGDRKLSDYAGVGSIDKCRDKEQALEVGRAGVGYWWKSTYAAPNPEAAAQFAVHALGAQRIESPFVHRAPYCPDVAWLILPDQEIQRTEEQASTAIPVDEQKTSAPSGIMLHFVKNNPLNWAQANMSIDALAELQGKIRSLSSDTFDEYMYSHVDFRAASLDPFIARFRKLDLPFIARKGRGYFALYVNVPDNNFVFKISSRGAPTLLDARKLDEASS